MGVQHESGGRGNFLPKLTSHHRPVHCKPSGAGFRRYGAPGTAFHPLTGGVARIRLDVRSRHRRRLLCSIVHQFEAMAGVILSIVPDALPLDWMKQPFGEPLFYAMPYHMIGTKLAVVP